MKDRNRTAWFIMIASVVMLFWFVRTQADEPAPNTPSVMRAATRPDADPGAWPVNPAPGTPAALHNQLMEAHQQGQVQHPTRIPAENEQRERGDKK